jgi:DNA-binding NarL/FixJ family response regulator
MQMPTAPAVLLTPRERQILGHIVMGLTNPQIASALALSVKTVEWHRANLMRKLGVHNAAGLVRHALRQGLLRDELTPGKDLG